MKFTKLVLAGLLSALVATPTLACLKRPAGCVITSHYGSRTVGGVADFHNGLDFGCASGTPVYAAEDGQIIASRFSQHNAGNMVIIGSGGHETRYFHNTRLLFPDAPASVKAGDLIAYSGNTGGSKSNPNYVLRPHVHFEFRQGGAYADPEQQLCDGPGPSNGPMDGGTDFPDENGSGGGTSGGGSGPAPEMYTLDDESLYELLAEVISSRALNPDYPRQLSTLSKERLYGELAYLETINMRLNQEILKHKERTTGLQAMMTSLRLEQTMNRQLDAARAAAVKAGGPTR